MKRMYNNLCTPVSQNHIYLKLTEKINEKFSVEDGKSEIIPDFLDYISNINSNNVESLEKSDGEGPEKI